MLQEILYETADVLRMTGRLEYRFGRGLTKLVALVVVIGGLAFLWDGAKAICGGSEPFAQGLFEFCVLGPSCLIVGIICAGLRRSVVLDIRDQAVTVCWRFAFPLCPKYWRRVHPLDRFDTVAVRRSEKQLPGYIRPYLMYPVVLQGPYDRVTVIRPRDYVVAQTVALEISNLLGIEFSDEVCRSVGHSEGSSPEPVAVADGTRETGICNGPSVTGVPQAPGVEGSGT